MDKGLAPEIFLPSARAFTSETLGDLSHSFEITDGMWSTGRPGQVQCWQILASNNASDRFIYRHSVHMAMVKAFDVDVQTRPQIIKALRLGKPGLAISVPRVSHAFWS